MTITNIIPMPILSPCLRSNRNFNNCLRESQRLRERGRQNRCDGSSFSRLPVVYWPSLTFAPLTWRDSRTEHYTGLSFSIFTLHFLEAGYCLYPNWFKPYQWGPNGNFLHCLLLELDFRGTFSEHCWSGNSRGKKHRAHPNPFIKNNRSRANAIINE